MTCCHDAKGLLSSQVCGPSPWWPLILFSRAFLRPFLVAQRSKRPNTDFARTTVKTTIYSHDGKNDRNVIFDRGAAKMNEISWRDTFETTDLMFRSEILSPGQKFGNLTHFVTPQNVIPGSGRTMVKKTECKFLDLGRPKWLKFSGGILSRPLASCSRAKISLQGKNLEIWPISSHLKMWSQVLVARWSKISNLHFRPWGGPNVWNFQKGYFRDHWPHGPEQNSLSMVKIRKVGPVRHNSKCDPRF